MFDNEKNKYVRLEPKVYIKYLRVLIDQNLSLKYHIDSITAITRRASFTQLFVVGSEANSLSSIVFVVKAINQDCSSVEGYKRNDNQP